MTRAYRWSEQRLPGGWLGAVRQLGLFAVGYYLYRVVRGFMDGQVSVAFVHARGIVGLEQSAHLFFEPGLQRWTLRHHWIVDVANWCYVNSHPAITTAFMVWLYLARTESFYRVRNTFLIAMVIALIGYVIFPTAPPRMLPEWGFTDTVSNWVGMSGSDTASVFFNPYAAVPSMHVAFAVMTGIPAMLLVRHRVLKLAWGLYPLIVTLSVIVTANHFWIDSALGVATAAVAAVFAQLAFAPRTSWARPQRPFGAQAPA